MKMDASRAGTWMDSHEIKKEQLMEVLKSLPIPASVKIIKNSLLAAILKSAGGCRKKRNPAILPGLMLILPILWFLPPAVLGQQDTLVRPSEADGWVPLFNGKDLTGWNIILQGKKINEDPDKVFQVVDGVIHVYKDHKDQGSAPAGYIGSVEEYSNYHLWFEWKWLKKRFGGRKNSKRDAGLIYHYSGKDKVWPHGVEYQIQEGDCGDIWMVYNVWMDCYKNAEEGGESKRVGGSGISRYKKTLTNEVDGWNYGEVILIGDSLVHLINGVVNNRCGNIVENSNKQPMTKGKILFQSEWAELQYRNIYLQQLDSKGVPVFKPTTTAPRLSRNSIQPSPITALYSGSGIQYKIPQSLFQKKKSGRLEVYNLQGALQETFSLIEKEGFVSWRAKSHAKELYIFRIVWGPFSHRFYGVS